MQRTTPSSNTNDVSFLDTLHPEQGRHALHVQGPIPEDGSSWNAVWVEAVAIDAETGNNPPAAAQTPNTTEANGMSYDNGHGNKVNHLCRYNFLVLIIGGSLAVSAVAVTFGLEIGAAVVFLIAAGLRTASNNIHKVATHQPPLVAGLTSPILLLIQAVLSLPAAILLMVDGILLVTSTMVTEVLAGVGGLVCTIFGGVAVGQEYHQVIRRFSHLTRWAFRRFHNDWDVPRGWSQPPTTAQSTNSNTTNANLNVNQYQDVPVTYPDEDRADNPALNQPPQRDGVVSTPTAQHPQTNEVIVLGVEQHVDLVEDNALHKPDVMMVTQV